MKIFLFLFLFFNITYSDIRYKKGWNLLGGEVSLRNIDKEEIWTFSNDNWILRPSRIEKHQGFWFNAVTNGVLKTYEHKFEETLPGTYSLYSLSIQYLKLDKEINYTQYELQNSYLKINKNLSFSEYIMIQIQNSEPIKQSFSGEFKPLSGNTDIIVESEDKNDVYFVSSISLKGKVLILIRHEASAKYGKIDKKYTYIKY
jgi:hypothetical protein